ncbi:site-specific integrase [Xanthomonas arboricola]|uniref:site-specific integrase n=1 Tax=Xanthomonas arboricola TaxID=56448 RepID=UPI00063E7898|nr:site-specific integrase [Xanthomonas arboricola]
MRNRQYLSRSLPSGRWSFRQRVPNDLQPLLGQQTIKRTLHTSILEEAQLRAATLASHYERLFDQLRADGLQNRSKEDASALLAGSSAVAPFRNLTLHRTRTPDGTVHERWQIDSPEGVRLFRALHEGIALEGKQVGALPTSPLAVAAYATKTGSSIEPMTLGKAQRAWLATLKGRTLPKTYVIKKSAIQALVDHLGERTKIHRVTRSDLARWYQQMRKEGASTPTLTNKQSYIGGKGGFFDWAIASGHYPKGDNPAKGHVSYSARERRARRKLGFKAFDREQIQALFSPAVLERVPLAARWAMLIGLYTGARVSEVGQLLTSDVCEEDGIPCIRISDEGEHQKVKTEASLRIVPIHPALIRLGFLGWVEELRAAGHQRLFPAAKADALNGQGNWITKAFGRHLAEVGKNWSPAKRGFHSLRKTLIQELQGAGVVAELRAQIVGHELNDEHHATYSRTFTVKEKLCGFGNCRGLDSAVYWRN